MLIMIIITMMMVIMMVIMMGKVVSHCIIKIDTCIFQSHDDHNPDKCAHNVLKLFRFCHRQGLVIVVEHFASPLLQGTLVDRVKFSPMVHATTRERVKGSISTLRMLPLSHMVMVCTQDGRVHVCDQLRDLFDVGSSLCLVNKCLSILFIFKCFTHVCAFCL